jgi:hypothetical protein
MEMTITQIIVALFILSLCGTIIMFRKSNETYTGPQQCFNCNDHKCSVCPTYDPMFCIVNSAYVIRKQDGKVSATCTLTFKEDFVVAQSPAGGDEKWQIPNLVGHYKTSVMKWVDSEHKIAGEEREATFS